MNGVSSAAVVARLRRALGVGRAGHTGTLDPMATGVLPVCLGEATKIAGYLIAGDKAYEGELELGVETDTLDAQGTVTRRAPVAVSREALAAALEARLGDGMQVPPMYSAVHRGGRRLHELARRGVEVEREARPIRVDELVLTAFEPPRARFRVACSKGTYVRGLVADVGAALGCGAHLTALRRTRSGPFAIERAVPLLGLDADTARRHLVDPADALAHLPARVVPADRLAAVAHGQRLAWAEIAPLAETPTAEIRLLTPENRLLALADVAGGRLRYLRVFSYGLTPGADSSKLSPL